jgi:hypothetical protein
VKSSNGSKVTASHFHKGDRPCPRFQSARC